VATGAEAVEAYLAARPPDQRAALQDLRAQLRALLPDHIECLSYAMPGFRAPGPKGKMVAGYAGFARNCGFYPHSGNIIPQFAADLTGFKTTPGAVQFTPDHPIPLPLLEKLVRARQAEVAAGNQRPRP
jgi:uncharacterized protein YdhG (YjbR/CyaY superfamily)